MEAAIINLGDANVWTAIGTVSMAVTTLAVVVISLLNRRDDARRHQDSYKPICLLTPYDGVDPRHRRDTLLAIANEQSNPGFGMVEVRCALRNIGSGPALNVGIMFRFLDMNGYTTQRWELSPLRPGELRGSEEEPLRVPLQFAAHFNQTDFSQIVGKLWEIIVVYEDIFGNPFFTVHEKKPQQLDRLYQVSGSQDFAAPSQRWVTFGSGTISDSRAP